MAEQIRTIAIGLYLCQQHRGFGVVDRLPFHRFLAVVSHFHAVLELRAGDGNRIVIRDAVHRIRRHFVVVVVEPNRIRRHRQQIQRLAGLTSSIERRIASCGGLRNLVLHGIEVGAVLTGLLIRTDDDAFLRIDNLRRTCHDGIARRDGLLLYRGANRIQGRILRVVNDLRDIVAFQFQYQLQVIAQVVRTQAEAKDLVGLVLAADETTRQPHFRLVVHVYAIQGILQPQGAATVDIHESVSGKRVTGLEHLQREGVVLGHLDREIARTVGLVNRITGAHDLSIQFQARIAHRYRRVLVQHASAEANGRDVLKRQSFRNGVVLAQRDGSRTHVRVVVVERGIRTGRSDGIGLALPIAQCVEHKCTGGIGNSRQPAHSFTRQRYRHTGATHAVCVRNPSADLTVRRTPSGAGSHIGSAGALARVAGSYAIVVSLVRSGMCVAVIGNCHRGQRIVVRSALLTAVDTETVNASVARSPGQEHAVPVRTLRRLQVLYLRYRIEIQVGAVNHLRIQRCGVKYLQRRVGLVQTNLIAVMDAGAVGDIGHMDVPRSVAVQLHAVVRDRCLHRLARLYQRTFQPQARTVVPVAIRRAGRIQTVQLRLDVAVQFRADGVVVQCSRPCLIDGIRQLVTARVVAGQPSVVVGGDSETVRVTHTCRRNGGVHDSLSVIPYGEFEITRVGRNQMLLFLVETRERVRLEYIGVGLGPIVRQLVREVLDLAFHGAACVRIQIQFHQRGVVHQLRREAALVLGLQRHVDRLMRYFQIEMHFAVGVKIRVFGIVLLHFRQRGQVVVLDHTVLLGEIVRPSPHRRRCTAYAVIDGPPRTDQLVAGQRTFERVHPVAILVIGIVPARLGVRFGDRIRCCLRFAHRLHRVVGIVIDGAVFRVWQHPDGLRVAEIGFERTLHFEHIAFDNILGRRVVDLPLQIHLTRCTLLRIQCLGALQRIHTVVGGDMHCVRIQALPRAGRPVLVGLKLSRDKSLHRVLGWNHYRTRTVARLHFYRIQRSVITDRVLEHHILHGSTTVTRRTVRIHRVQIRLVQLRGLGDIAARVYLRPTPVFVVRFIAARLLVDGRTHTPFELLTAQRGRGIPVERDIRDILVSVVVLAFQANGVLLPVRTVVGVQHELLTVIRTADDGTARMHIHIAFADIMRRRILTSLYTRYRSDAVHVLVGALRHLIPYIRVVTPVEIIRAPQVIVVRATVHPNGDVEPQHTFAHAHHCIMALLFQIIIRLCSFHTYPC